MSHSLRVHVTLSQWIEPKKSKFESKFAALDFQFVSLSFELQSAFKLEGQAYSNWKANAANLDWNSNFICSNLSWECRIYACTPSTFNHVLIDSEWYYHRLKFIKLKVSLCVFPSRWQHVICKMPRSEIPTINNIFLSSWLDCHLSEICAKTIHHHFYFELCSTYHRWYNNSLHIRIYNNKDQCTL